METKKIHNIQQKSCPYSTIAGLSFFAIALVELWVFNIDLKNYISWTLSNPQNIIQYSANYLLDRYWLPIFLSCLLIATCLFRKKHNVIIIVACAILTLTALLNFIEGFGNGAYTIHSYTYNWGCLDVEDFIVEENNFNFICVLPTLLHLMGLIGIFCIAAVTMTAPLKKYTLIITKMWFIPSVFFLTELFGVIILLILSKMKILNGYCNILFDYSYLLEFLISILLIPATLFTSMWCIWPDGKPKRKITTNIVRQANDSNGEHEMTTRFCSYCGNEILPQAVICPHCGCAVAAAPEADIPSTGLNVLSFFIPLVGLILYCIHQSKTPNKAKAIGKWSLIGFCVGLAGSIILCLVVFSLLL